MHEASVLSLFSDHRWFVLFLALALAGKSVADDASNPNLLDRPNAARVPEESQCEPTSLAELNLLPEGRE